ncbi:hypothetical protein [Rhizobium terrae]|uniref:hypothetical protein n=1 Tax=Rhizobium terrae TaxID=2171756 RepID=UPI0013C2BAB4|nr:hypothetical protein [Rhizobium terrae]
MLKRLAYISLIERRTPPPSVVGYGSTTSSSSQLSIKFKAWRTLLPRQAFCVFGLRHVFRVQPSQEIEVCGKVEFGSWADPKRGSLACCACAGQNTQPSDMLALSVDGLVVSFAGMIRAA